MRRGGIVGSHPCRHPAPLFKRFLDDSGATFHGTSDQERRIARQRLYRASHGTFEEYCRERWGMARNYANKMIAAATVVSNLGTTVPIPQTESQARPLAGLPQKEQAEAWPRRRLAGWRCGQRRGRRMRLQRPTGPDGWDAGGGGAGPARGRAGGGKRVRKSSVKIWQRIVSSGLSEGGKHPRNGKRAKPPRGPILACQNAVDRILTDSPADSGSFVQFCRFLKNTKKSPQIGTLAFIYGVFIW